MDSLGSLIIYAILALSMVGFAILAVTTRKILRSATFLLFTLFATAGVYFMLDYEFLGAVQIAVYAGGIVVLFVFSILLTTHPGDNSEKLHSRRRSMGLVAALAMLGVSAYALISRCSLLCTPAPEMQTPDMHKIGAQLVGDAANSATSGAYLLPFEAISVLLLACIIGGVVVARKR